MRQGDIADIQARVQRSWYADGLYDLLSGGFFVVIGAAWLMTPALRWLATALMVILIVLLARHRELLLRLKERITFPHGGYAVPKRPSWSRRVLASVVLVSPMLAATRLEGVLRAAGWMDPYSTSVMTTMGLCCLGVGAWFSIRSYGLAGVLALALSFVLPLAGLSGATVLGAFYLVLGVAFLAYGAFTLRGFLRRAAIGPIGEETTDA